MQRETTPQTDLLYEAKDHPIRFLKAFAAMSRSPDWKTTAFDHETLDWIAQVWAEAAIAAAGDARVRDACLKEKERYEGLARQLKDGMMERLEPGCVFLDSVSDWPKPQVIRGAIKALTHAQVGRLQ